MHKCVVVLFVLFMVTICTSQVNFSTGWGKRGLNQSPTIDNNCKTPYEMMTLIYKLIQVSVTKTIANYINMLLYFNFFF